MEANDILQTLLGIAAVLAVPLGTALACAIAGGNRRFDEQDEGLTALDVHQLITDERDR